MPRPTKARTMARRDRPTPRGRAASTAPAGPVVITRTVHFNAAHRLHNPTKIRGLEPRRFGLCNNPNWHGHNYVLEVSVRGEPDPETGYLIDLSELKEILERVIVDKCDHRNLNLDVDFLRGIIPSTENLVIAFWRELEPRCLRAGRLHCVRLYETPRNFAEYCGPGGRSCPAEKPATAARHRMWRRFRPGGITNRSSKNEDEEEIQVYLHRAIGGAEPRIGG